LAREAGPRTSRDLDDNDDLGKEATHRGCSQSIVVLSNSSDEEDEAVVANQPAVGDAAASSSWDLEEGERQDRLEAERCSKFNAKRSILRQDSAVPHGKEPVGETSTPPPQVSSIPSKRGWI
jgi:hypothetical protein